MQFSKLSLLVFFSIWDFLLNEIIQFMTTIFPRKKKKDNHVQSKLLPFLLSLLLQESNFVLHINNMNINTTGTNNHSNSSYLIPTIQTKKPMLSKPKIQPCIPSEVHLHSYQTSQRPGFGNSKGVRHRRMRGQGAGGPGNPVGRAVKLVDDGPRRRR